ncbi:carbohydrate-binding module family 50 protein, partial [Piedraia hortae CBS 480.64]
AATCGTPMPTPTQPGAVSGCAVYYKVQAGDDCDTIARNLSATAVDVKAWTPTIGDQYWNLWANYYI